MPAYIYLEINGIASASALLLVSTFNWNLGMQTGTSASRLTQILASGFGAMGIFRSALFIYRHNGEDIGIGPIAFLQVMLDATDRAVDRRRAKARDRAMGEIMHDLAFADVVVALPTLAGNVMQNFSIEDQIRLGTQVKNLRDEKDLSDRIKVIELGLIVMNVVGEQVLTVLVDTIRRERDQQPDRTDESRGALANLLSAIRRRGVATPGSTAIAPEADHTPTSSASTGVSPAGEETVAVDQQPADPGHTDAAQGDPEHPA
jgi:hypothetical protein